MDIMKVRDKRLNRTYVLNVLKTIFAYILSSLAGYLFYIFTLYGMNKQVPEGAGIRTSFLV